VTYESLASTLNYFADSRTSKIKGKISSKRSRDQKRHVGFAHMESTAIDHIANVSNSGDRASLPVAIFINSGISDHNALK
jgi:hypothetical protein